MRNFVTKGRRVALLRAALGNALAAPTETRWMSNFMITNEFIKNVQKIQENTNRIVPELMPTLNNILDNLDSFQTFNDLMKFYQKVILDLQVINVINIIKLI